MVTSDAVAKNKHLGVCYGATYDCNSMDDGVAMIDSDVKNSPYKQGVTSSNIMYLVTFCIRDNNYYRCQMTIGYSDNSLCIRSYRDAGWLSWKRIDS